MISVENALNLIQSSVSPLKENEKADLFNAAGRVLSNDIIAEYNVPLQNNSAMDGYAVLYADTASATRDSPVILTVTDEIRAGEKSEGKAIKSGFAIRIMTGAPVPSGADSIVPFEDTEESDGVIKIIKSFAEFENIRFAGEDIKKGETVLKKGTRINSAEIGLLASMNIPSIPVIRRPEVAIISTGDEIIEPGNDNPEGKTFNSNAYLLYTEIKKYGGNPHYAGIVNDERDRIRDKFQELLKYDIVISSGGVSMGKYDFIPDVLSELGVDIKIKKVLMKPGKPVVFGVNGNNLYFGLPGNPVSVMVSFLKFVRPAILRMSGSDKTGKPLVKAVALEDIKKKSGRKHFIRGIFSIKNGNFYVETTGAQGSGILTSMSRANCFIVLPEETENVRSGDTVEIELINHGEI